MKKQYNLDICTKCEKPTTPTATGVCKPCREEPCYWCGVKTLSKKKPITCAPCSKLSMKKKEELRSKTSRNPGVTV